MKKIFFYCTAGCLAVATACSTADTGTNADASTYETSETVTAAGSTDDATMDTETTGTTETGTTGTTGTETNTTGTTEMGSMGTTGTATDMNTDMAGEMAALTNLDDATFLMTAASSNMMEIELGKMVAQKATNPEVKQFAQMMVDHHTKATQELKSVASQMGVTLPTTMMPMHQSMIDKVSDKSGAELEEKYMDTMETAHKMDIAMFEAKSQNANETNVKSFASKTLPTLKQHKEKADSIEDKVD
ncbi:DUF4142 domain-containing protein [Pontibacter sp. H249]|uniref:DUF4142 domain-containing protein n=1 Tax=Pontibacter sp. H249 TaxID=3133420 RepID=UPI0030BE06F6